MGIKAVAFDIDGTLYSAPRFNLVALPLGLRHARLFAAFGEVRHELHRLAREGGPEGRAPADLAAFRRLQAELLAPRVGASPEEALALLDRVIYGELDALFARVRPYSGAAPALAALRSGGLRLAALSDFPAPRKLERLGLAAYFELARCSEDGGLLKPAPKPFLALAAELGLAPAEILYVGNSLRYDLVGAKAAGMPVAILTRRAAPGADLTFFDWDRLVSFALGLRG